MYDEFNRTERCYITNPDKGVEILVPPQKIYTRVNVGVIVPAEWNRISQYRKGFSPIRDVINFEVVDDDCNVIPEFAPPIELKVYFTADEYNIVNGQINELQLAFLPQGAMQWIPFTGPKHPIRRALIDHWPNLAPAQGNRWVGYFVVEISHWGDPSVSVGQ